MRDYKFKKIAFNAAVFAAFAAVSAFSASTAVADAVAKVGTAEYTTLAAAFEAAESGNTVTLVADATEDVEITKDITLDLGGKTLTNANAGKATLTIAAGATATVKNGSLIGGTSYYTIQNNGTATFEGLTVTAGNTGSSMLDNHGTLTINSGAYTGGMNTVKNEPNATLTVKGGTFETSYGENLAHTGVIYNYGSVEIVDGAFTQKATSPNWAYPHVVMTVSAEGSTPSTIIKGGTFTSTLKNWKGAILMYDGKGSAGCTEVSGGTFNMKVSDSYCAAGYRSVEISDGVYGIADAIQVESADGTVVKTYHSLKEAFDAATSGQTVKLLADLTETDAKSDAVPYIMTGVTFDLNGKTYTHYNYAHTFQGTGGVIKNGKIVCAPYGSDEGAANGSYALFIGYHVGDKGVHEEDAKAETTSFTVQNVTMTGGINISHATGVVLDNLTVNGTKYYAVWTEEGSSVTIKSGTYTTGAVAVLNGEKTTTIEVEGGTFTAGEKSLIYTSGVVPSISGGTFDTAVDAKYCASGFIPAQNSDGTYGVAGAIQVLNADKTVAGSYHSLADAFAAATSGQTVKLLADLTENATIAKNLTLDLNGYTLNGGTVKATPTLTVTAKVTIKDSSEAQTGTIKREDTAANSGVTSHYVIDIQGSDASLTFESGKVVNNSGTIEGERAGASLVRLGDDGKKDAMPTLTIKGGTFTQNNFTAIKVDYGTFYFQGGTITCENDEAVKNWACAYIQGGTVNGTVASWVYSKSICSSTLEISGGTINGNVYAMTYDGAGDKTATVEITGGTITGDLGIYQGKNIKDMTKVSDSSKATIAITGGKFNKEVKESGYLAKGLTTIYSESETLYVVAPENSELLTVATETTTESSETETPTVQVVLPAAVITEALEKAGVSDTSKADTTAKVSALSAKADNGNPVWVNIVAGIESDKSVAVDAAQNTDASTIEIAVPKIDEQKTAAGFSIAYEVDEVNLTTSDDSTTAEVTKAGDVVSAPAIDVDNVETSALFRVNVVLRQNGSTVATVPATNYIGVLKKTTKMTKTIVPVPWHSLADGGDISVSNVVKTANLSTDDKLSVYDVANKKYNVYTLKEDKTWEPAAVYVIDANGQVSESSSGTPTTTLIPRGSGVWLERSNTDTPIVTYGLASTEKQTTTLVAAKSEEGDEGTTTATWSLVAVPTTEAVSLATLSDPKEATNDAVIVPTEGAPRIYTVAEDGKWGYNEASEVKDANGKVQGVRVQRKTDDATLPAGTGFWYVNGGGEKSVNW